MSESTYPHLVWDWNGTLLDDLAVVVAATNVSLRLAGGVPVTADDHRRDFRRPVIEYYRFALGRDVLPEEFDRLDRAFHDEYDRLLPSCALTADAPAAVRSWPGTQSLLSMWFHDALVATLARYPLAGFFDRVDGLRASVGGGLKAPHLAAHLAALGRSGADCVLIGDSLDDAAAAASVGARCVLFAGGFTDEPRLRATGLPVARTLTEAVALAGADRPVPGTAAGVPGADWPVPGAAVRVPGTAVGVPGAVAGVAGTAVGVAETAPVRSGAGDDQQGLGF